VNAQQNGSDKCGFTTVIASGSFATNGVGGTVTYYWVETDSTGSHVVNEPPIVVAAGNTSTHSVVTDKWVPASSGTEQLVFTTPQAQAPATQSITQSFTCR
jgi:hypothetical protein